MELPRGLVATLLAGLALAATVWGQQDCMCTNNKRTLCNYEDGRCVCRIFGSNATVDCETLTSKCLLMKAEVAGTVSGRRNRPKTAYVDNDGIYNPECDDKGRFKPKQCNGTSTCWCVNSAGVRRTEKKDTNFTCSEVVRTSWIILEIKHLDRDDTLEEESVRSAIRTELSGRYGLHPKHINVTYEPPYIIVDLKQNASEKSLRDVDIADVAYYIEKDVKGDSLIAGNQLNFRVPGEPLKLDGVVIYFVDDKPPEFSMKRLTAGVIAVIVVVVLAIVAGILVLVFTRRKRGKYEKAEVKEMNEMHRELKS